MGGAGLRVAGAVAGNGLAAMARGQRPKFEDLLLTPANASRFARELAGLRGAAMKMGQLLSLEAGDILPPEVAAAFTQLRAEAEIMPPRQLKQVLTQAYGKNFTRNFSRFEVKPLAAASIGQVHRAVTQDGREIALKVQYPGVRDSIDSDVANLAAMIRWSGQMPEGLDLTETFEAIRRQLHEEADYKREATAQTRFRAALIDHDHVIIPKVDHDLSTGDILAMDFMDSVPLEEIEAGPQAQRDWVARTLFELLLWEVFDGHLMQTDPNLANFRLSRDGQRLVLLDFGATQEIAPDIAEQYGALLSAGLSADQERAWATVTTLGYVSGRESEEHRRRLLSMFDMVLEPFRTEGPYDFGSSTLMPRLRDAGFEIAADPSLWHLPPPESLFLHRKVAGMFLLAVRLRARVDVGRLVARYSARPQDRRAHSA
jgi:predicted unusual protein kinase regulating ubiquinone biosynthesis (AarF/ABC1/UbiB family)